MISRGTWRVSKLQEYTNNYLTGYVFTDKVGYTINQVNPNRRTTMNKMSTSGLVNEISRQLPYISKEHIKAVLNEAAKEVVSIVKNGDAVTFTGLGIFKPSDKPARVCRNPITGGDVQVPAKRVLKLHVEAGNKDL